MSKDDSLEQQINQFYAHVPEVQDALPMKDYLLKHENNQMAWYLLGKQYMARGQEAKANYCFAQSGSVYEAFEAKANPLLGGADRLKNGQARQAATWIRKKRSWVAGAGIVLLLILGLGLPGGRAAAPNPLPEVLPPAPIQLNEGLSGGGEPATGGSEGTGATGVTVPKPKSHAYMAGVSAPEIDGNRVLGELLTSKSAEPSSLIFEAPMLGKWTDWLQSGSPIAEVKPAAGKAAAAVDWLSSEWCPCQAAQEGTSAKQTIAAWKPLQESKLVLRSAITHYRARTGKWPDSPKALAGAYPNNTMSGWKEEQTAWFTEITAALAAAAKGGASGTTVLAASWPATSGKDEAKGKPAGALQALTVKPIEIIIDKTRHRLAVVSGNVLLRNYAVGLGAADTATPEGAFVITEKVRNPNGSDAGSFGSRGMTLSNTLYAIHGTDEPSSIGKDESHGCVRMKKADVEELFDLVQLGTKVTIMKGGLPSELRTPAERFRLAPQQDETNPHKKYEWLN